MSSSEKIRQLRKEKGLTQKQLAEKTGIAAITIQQYEAGKYEPKLDKLRRIAAALDVTIGELEPNWGTFTPDEIAKDWNGKNETQKTITFSQEGTWVGSGETSLIFDYRKLNKIGKKEALKRVEELTEIKKYTDESSN